MRQAIAIAILFLVPIGISASTPTPSTTVEDWANANENWFISGEMSPTCAGDECVLRINSASHARTYQDICLGMAQGVHHLVVPFYQHALSGTGDVTITVTTEAGHRITARLDIRSGIHPGATIDSLKDDSQARLVRGTAAAVDWWELVFYFSPQEGLVGLKLGRNQVSNFQLYPGTPGDLGLARIDIESFPDAGQSIRIDIGTIRTQGQHQPSECRLPMTPPAPQIVRGPGRGEVEVRIAHPFSNGGSAITNYQLYRDGSLVGTTDISRKFVLGGLTDGELVAMAVRALNQLGESEISPEGTGSAPTVSTEPRELSLAGTRSDSVVLRWSPPADTGGTKIAHYDLYRTPAGGTESYIGSTTSTYYVSNTGPLEAHSYKVHAVNLVGAGPPSAPVCVIGPTPGEERLGGTWMLSAACDDAREASPGLSEALFKTT